jgi:signal transduction histidine kinase
MGKKIKKSSSTRSRRRASVKGRRPKSTRHLLERQTRLYNEAKKSNKELQKATEYKSQFLARMSHEIRIPLSIVVGFLDILSSGNLGPLNEKQRAALDKMEVQSQRLQKMIGSVLRISQIEEGIIPLDISTFSMAGIIESLRAVADDLQRKTGLKVIWEIGRDLPPITSDAPKLEEIIQNLIVNAFKYTSEGEIRIRIINRAESKSIECVVQDTGMGITPENFPKIFDGFHQIDATASSQGVGLGLAIVKNYLDLLKGKIQVQSQPGKGSTFTITLPYKLEV